MTLERYWSILLKRWHILVLCVVIVSVGTYIGSRLITPIYRSSVLVQVTIHTTSNSTDINNLLASDQLVQTESQLAMSSPVIHDVVSRFPGLTADQLTAATTSSYKINTQLFEIDVVDASPKKAAALANDIAATLIKQQVQENQLDNGHSQQQLQQEVDTTYRRVITTQNSMNAIQKHITNLVAVKGAVDQIAVLQAQMSSLDSQLSQQQEYYNQWQTMLTQMKLAEAQNNGFLRVAQPAQPSISPIRPQILLNTALGFVAGLFLGFVLCLLIEQLDTRVHTAEEIAQLLNWPILGVVWNIDRAKNKKETLIDLNDNNTNSEAYRILRANIGFSAVDKAVRSLVVTSGLPFDGKSTIASNLAIFMARAGKNTLLIDADLHRPTLHKNFVIHEETKGLSDAIVACSQHQSLMPKPPATPEACTNFLKPYIQDVSIANLHVMLSGSLPPNPSELLDSTAMGNLLTIIMNSKIDMVIFDTPPLLGLADTRTLTSKVDGTVVVADVTRTTRKNLLQVKALLRLSGTRILGCVVNKQRRTRREVSYYYYNESAEPQQEEKSGFDEHCLASPAVALHVAQSGGEKQLK